jgi:hypothetical protein
MTWRQIFVAIIAKSRENTMAYRLQPRIKTYQSNLFDEIDLIIQLNNRINGYLDKQVKCIYLGV